MFQRFRSIWIPGGYHGGSPEQVFFEGWYFKLINQDLSQRWAFIPGIFNHPSQERRHAFIQVLNGMENQVTYHRFDVKAFQASRKAFHLAVGSNQFHSGGCVLKLDGNGQQIKGEVRLNDLKPWPVHLFSPGVMGPYNFVPYMQTYHGILSLDHEIQGTLQINGEQQDFTEGRGYIEKDWGSTFPRAYIWMQSNHFEKLGISLTASVATIPWLGSWFRGFLIGLLINGKLYRFTTYLGSDIRSLVVTNKYVSWTVIGTSRSDPNRQYPGYKLTIQAERGAGGLLSSPELDGMQPRILESLTAEIHLGFYALDSAGEVVKALFQGTGTCAGLEVAGSIEELIDPLPGED